jgi:hypothetical protein
VTTANVFAYEPDRARSVLARMRLAPDSSVVMDGADWANAAMGALIEAELLAAQAGVVPLLELPSGEKGILSVGAAREHMDHAPEDVRVIYLATHGLVRATHAAAKAPSGNAPALIAEQGLGVLPLVWVLVVVGVAAVIAGAAYFIHKDSIEVEGHNVRTTAIASEAASLARDQLARTGQIDPEVWSMFRSMAEAEANHSMIPLLVGGGVALAGVAGVVLAWRRWKQSERGAS